MDKQTIPTDSTLMSLKDYGGYDFPIQFYMDDFKKMPLGHVNWHWHTQIEFSYVLSGEMECCVGETKNSLRQGEAVFINSERLHMSKPFSEDADTSALSIVFSPAILAHGIESAVYQKYISPIILAKNLPYVVLKGDIYWQSEILKSISKLHDLYREQAYGFELMVQAMLVQMWLTLVLHLERDAQGNNAEPVSEGRLKRMVTYIQTMYNQTVTLEQIAASASVSKSECIRCFKSRLGITPIEYLVEFRISRAMLLLMSTRLPVSEIGQRCGFDSASYFTKIFRQRTGVAPSGYRKRHS